MEMIKKIICASVMVCILLVPVALGSDDDGFGIIDKDCNIDTMGGDSLVRLQDYVEVLASEDKVEEEDNTDYYSEGPVNIWGVTDDSVDGNVGYVLGVVDYDDKDNDDDNDGSSDKSSASASAKSALSKSASSASKSAKSALSKSASSASRSPKSASPTITINKKDMYDISTEIDNTGYTLQTVSVVSSSATSSDPIIK